MPPITALLHTANDALHLGRTLETLLPCAEILIVDHHSRDATERVARQYGARIVSSDNDTDVGHNLADARHEWIFCISPGESMTEGLQASLFEWSLLPAHEVEGRFFSLMVREQSGGIWRDLSVPETRLIPRKWTRWDGHLPAHDPAAVMLEGELSRFV